MYLAFKIRNDGREICTDTVIGSREYKRRRKIMTERQDYLCAICIEFMYEPTFDHQNGRGMGGSLRDDRIEIDGQWFNAALCLRCQGIKGSRRYAWMDGMYVPIERARKATGESA